MYGDPLANVGVGFFSVRHWYKSLSYELYPPRNNRSLCQYLVEEDEETGMRAYVDYIFHSQYLTVLTDLALSRTGALRQGGGGGGEGGDGVALSPLIVPELRPLTDRTMTACFEDLSHQNSTIVLATIRRVQDFLFNGTNYRPWSGKLELMQSGGGGHSTSHDSALRDRLQRIVRQIDETFYDGDIAWLDSSIFSC